MGPGLRSVRIARLARMTLTNLSPTAQVLKLPRASEASPQTDKACILEIT
jgi:hypothetical protein